jgi:hypothetical protein
LAVTFVQFSCKDFWHPEGPTPEPPEQIDPETNYATITLKNANIDYFCYNAILHSITTGNNYQFTSFNIWTGPSTQTSLKVPAGTYYITADTSTSINGISMRSADFTVEERTEKIVTYYFSYGGGELRL